MKIMATMATMATDTATNNGDKPISRDISILYHVMSRILYDITTLYSNKCALIPSAVSYLGLASDRILSGSTLYHII